MLIIQSHKRILPAVLPAVLVVMLALCTTGSLAQIGIPSDRSARSAVNSDTRLITTSIEHYKDMMFLSQTGIDRATDSRVKEMAQQMLTDHSGLMYSMEQLQAAGGAAPAASNEDKSQSPAAMLNTGLAKVAGADFDSVWVAGMLSMQQTKYDQLTQAKETVTNPQLKTAVTEASTVIRKQVSQLKSIQKYLIRNAIQKRKEEEMKRKEEELKRRSRD